MANKKPGKYIYYLRWMDENGMYFRQYQSEEARDKRLEQIKKENRQLKRDSEFYAIKIRKWQTKIEMPYDISRAASLFC